MQYSRVKITTTVPIKDADALREAIGKVGAGQVGEYSYCSFSVTGFGRFKPSQQANPTIGQPGKLETVEEERIEVTCAREQAKAVVVAIRRAHPYEEAIVDITPLIDEDQL